MYDRSGGLDRDAYLEKYAPLVKRIAYHFMLKLPPSVQVDDLIQVGLIGLLDAVNNYNGSQGAQFETYAVQRIRGAILDELRQADWLPRSARKNMRRIEAAVSKLEQQLGRQPSEQELADSMQMPLAEYQSMLQDGRGCQLLHLEDLRDSEEEGFLDRHLGDERDNPAALLEDAGLREVLVKAIEHLPEREKLVMSLYYEQEMNLREIGSVLGVSESRVCQLHSQAVARLRVKVKDWLAE